MAISIKDDVAEISTYYQEDVGKSSRNEKASAFIGDVYKAGVRHRQQINRALKEAPQARPMSALPSASPWARGKEAPAFKGATAGIEPHPHEDVNINQKREGECAEKVDESADEVSHCTAAANVDI